MKKELTFALACASTFALFAVDITPKADFELYDVDAPVAGISDPNGALHWIYTGSSGSEDGSKVQAYETQTTQYGSKYLSLSTEGGTLWRSLSSENANAEGGLGTAQEIPPDGLYIDTMVQFTPTEDGGDPEPDKDDKLAIWLNVDSSGEAPVTNLMVKAGAYDAQGTLSSKSFVLAGATVEAGIWYRLTVEAIDDVCIAGNPFADFYKMPAFVIKLNKATLASAESAFNASFVQQLKESAVISPETANDIGAGRVFPSLVAGTPGQPSTLQAVGFKGSGALDNLAITDKDPHASGGDPTFEVDWGKDTVTAVWGETPPTADELAAIQAWATTNGLSAAQIAGETGAAAYLLGMTEVPKEVPTLSITSIDQTENGWTVTVACSAQPNLSEAKGKFTVKTAKSLGETWEVQTYDVENRKFVDGKVVIKITGADARFIKAALTK